MFVIDDHVICIFAVRGQADRARDAINAIGRNAVDVMRKRWGKTQREKDGGEGELPPGLQEAERESRALHAFLVGLGNGVWEIRALCRTRVTRSIAGRGMCVHSGRHRRRDCKMRPRERSISNNKPNARFKSRRREMNGNDGVRLRACWHR
jgi:hypothetical protein